LPGLGIPLGAAALVVGILGLRRADRSADAKGRVRACIGIATGGFFLLLNLILLAVFLAVISRRR
jgi:hypothetical protein